LAVDNLVGAQVVLADGADRTPPATAYEIAAQASRDLNAVLAKWQTVKVQLGK